MARGWLEQSKKGCIGVSGIATQTTVFYVSTNLSSIATWCYYLLFLYIILYNITKILVNLK